MLASAAAPAWTIFALVALGMAAFGLATWFVVWRADWRPIAARAAAVAPAASAVPP